MTEIEKLTEAIESGLKERLPQQRVTQRRNIALLSAALLKASDVNLMELGHALPVDTDNRMSRYQKMKRIVANHLIKHEEVMAPFAQEVLEKASANGQKPVIIIDQSQATTLYRHEMLLVALQIGGRALPLTWVVRETKGAIGFSDQKMLLERVASWLPFGVKPVLMGDRFYGNCDLIQWCSAQGWSWRLRLKESLLAYDQNGGEIKLRECFERGEWFLSNVYLTKRHVLTHVAITHEAGHPEPWIIALSEPPTSGRALDYSMRWAIEAMFSDLKSRGFDLENSQLRKADRLERLILGTTIAMYWAVSTGMWDRVYNSTAAEKKHPPIDPPDAPAPGYPSSNEVYGA